MEQQIQLGAFIRDMRMERGLTQQQLAERLGITDKAVSKWERDICYPDITLLRALADALGVSVSELLAGRREPDAFAAEDEAAAGCPEPRKSRLDWRLLAFMGLTAACIIATATCMICDLAVFRQLTWSPTVYLSLALGWIACIPLFMAKSHQIRWALVVLTIAAHPYLRLLGWVLKEPLIPKMSTFIVPMAAAYVWLVYLAFLRCRKWLAAGCVFLLAVPLHLGVMAVMRRYTGPLDIRDIEITITVLLLLAAVCLAADLILRLIHRR